MKNAPQLFAFEQDDHLASVRVIPNSNGEIWFVANDVCAALEIANPRNVIARLDEDEKGVHTMDTLGGKQELNCVNESGLYSLILTSRKESAKKFKKWITSEVLPSIRKTGGYQQGSTPSPTKLIELQKYSQHLVSRIAETAVPEVQQMLYDYLLQTQNLLGLSTPPLQAIAYGNVNELTAERLQQFFESVSALTVLGVAFNHSRNSDVLAINLNQFVALCKQHNLPVANKQTLTAALKQSPRLVASAITVNSCLINKSVKCWVFQQGVTNGGAV